MEKSMRPGWPKQEEYLSIIPKGMYPFSVSEYGERVFGLRKKRGYTRKKVAEFIGCSQQTIEKIEKGRYKIIERKWVPKLANCLECSCSYLLGFVDNETGVWTDPASSLNFPVIFYRADEIVSIADTVRAYNRDADLFKLFITMSKSSPKRRGHYRKCLKSILDGAE